MKHVFSILFHDIYDNDPDQSGFTGPGTRQYKISPAQFDRHLAVLNKIFDDPPVLVTHDAPDDYAFAITVDDGGVSYYTDVAARLEAIGWRAHCFVTTGRIGQRGFLTKRHIRELHKRGHVIGSHSASHPPQISVCKWDEIVSEWERSRKTLQDILGADITSASIPGGYFTRRVVQAASYAGLNTVFTSEPETRVRNIDGCRVLGRYTVRNSTSADLVMRLAKGNALARGREWGIWNGKKISKQILGAGYPKISEWVLRLGR